MADNNENQHLRSIDKRLTIIERSMKGVEEQIAFLIAKGVNQNELKFPGGEPSLFRLAAGDSRYTLGA